MSLFDTLRDAIFRHAAAPTSQSSATASSTASSGASTPSSVKPASPISTGAAPSGGGPAQPIDLQGTLDQLNARQPQRLNWRTSIVDLMKLVGMDSSLEHRQQMAKELGYSGSTSDTAAMNVWLHQEVMAKLARSGVKVPSANQQSSGINQPPGGQQSSSTQPRAGT